MNENSDENSLYVGHGMKMRKVIKHEMNIFYEMGNSKMFFTKNY